MKDRIRIFKHQAVPGGGSFEVRFADGRESLFFYWDNIPARRLRRDMMDRELQWRRQRRELLGKERVAVKQVGSAPAPQVVRRLVELT